jgi:DNA mismatch endonuclease (patch repair protein)
VAIEGARVRVDLLFGSARVVVFVDGCFWHGCRLHGTIPRANAAYWAAKIGRNRERDRRNTRLLIREGWRVVRIWEHESIGSAVARVIRALAECPTFRVARPPIRA